MSTDLDARLADLRREPQWSARERADVLTAVLATDPAPDPADLRLATTRTRRRRIGVLGAATGLAAACVAVPALLPSGSPGSASQAAAVQALHHLAHVAAAVGPSDRLGPKDYLHIVEVDSQAATSGQRPGRGRYEDWIRANGKTWQLRNERTAGLPADREVWLWPAGPQVIDGMTAPQYLDRLPTEPEALDSYVRAHTTGSTSADERVFVAVVDIVRRGLASPRLRSAAIEVLARLGHVRLGGITRDAHGHHVQEFDFVDPHGRPNDVRKILFNTRTGQITEEREYFRGTLFATRTVLVFDVVHSVPAEIRREAVPQK